MLQLYNKTGKQVWHKQTEKTKACVTSLEFKKVTKWKKMLNERLLLCMKSQFQQKIKLEISGILKQQGSLSC